MGARSGRPRLPAEVERRFWGAVREGMVIEAAAVVAGVSRAKGESWLRDRGGVMPAATAGQRTRCLSFAEREEIALLRAADVGVREIARRLARDPGTISRELRRVKHERQRGDRHRVAYRASTAQADADEKLRRPKDAKLATNLPLRREVQARLRENHSPEQIAGRLREDHPDDPEMWVSHEPVKISV